MLRGHVFSEQVFGVDIFALFINQFLGGHNGIIQSYKNAMEMTNTANSITINNGVAVIQGRYIEEHTETTLNYAKTDSLYCSLVIEIDLGKTNTKTSLEQARYKILEAESDYPALIQNDIANQIGNVYQFELARFQNGSTGIINFTDRRSYLSFDSVYSGIIQDNLESDSSTSALSAKQGKMLSEKMEQRIIPGQEFATNEYVDGKRVYGKRVIIAQLPNAKNLYLATDIPLSYKVQRLDGLYGGWFNINFYYPPNPPLSHGTYIRQDTNISTENWVLQIATGSDRSDLSGYVDVYYTKN